MSSPTTSFEHGAQQAAERSTLFLSRLGLSRIAGGILLVVLGTLVLLRPEFLIWFVGIGAIVVGLLMLAHVPERTR